jgi:DNA-directed RNA polymerase specialized sigma24 family protein
VALEIPLGQGLDESSAALDRFAEKTKSSPSKVAARHEAALRLADALASLSPVEREVIIQHGLEGATMHEVAARLERSADSTWKVWTRGLLKLRRLLPDQ